MLAQIAVVPFPDGVGNFLTVVIVLGQVGEIILPAVVIIEHLGLERSGFFAAEQTHLDGGRPLIFKARILPLLFHLNGGAFFVCDDVAFHNIHRLVRQHLHGVHLAVRTVTGRSLGFLHIIGAGKQPRLAVLLDGSGIGIALGVGLHHTHLGGAAGIGINGEFRAAKRLAGIVSCHLGQLHVTADDFIFKGIAVLIAVAVHGDHVICRQVYFHIFFIGNLVTIGSGNFLYIVRLNLPLAVHIHLIIDGQIIIYRHTVTVGGHGAHERIIFLLPIHRRRIGINTKGHTLQRLAVIGNDFFNAQVAVFGVALGVDKLTGSDGVPARVIAGAHHFCRLIASNHRYLNSRIDGVVPHIRGKSISIRRRNFFYPIIAGCQQSRSCHTVFISGDFFHQLGAGFVGIHTEHSPGQRIAFHIAAAPATAGLPLQGNFIQRQIAAVHFDPGFAVHGSQVALVNFLAVVHLIGNNGAVVHFAHQLHKGLGGQQGTAVTGSGLDGAFEGLHNTVFIGIDKVEDHALAAVGVHTAPGNTFALVLSFFIEISDIAGGDTHLHLAVLGGADQVDDHIFVFGHGNAVPAGIFFHLENAVSAHFHIIQGHHIVVIGDRAGDGGGTGRIGGQAGDFAAAQVTPFLGYLFRLIQQLVGIAAFFHIGDADHVAALHKLTVDKGDAVHLHIAHFQVGIVTFGVKVRLIGIVIVDQHILDHQILVIGIDDKIFILLQFLVPFFIVSTGFGAKGKGGGIIGGVENAQAVAFAIPGMVHHLADIVVVMGRGRKAGAVGDRHALAVLLAVFNIAVPIRLEHIQTGVLQFIADFPGQGGAVAGRSDGLFRTGTTHIFSAFIFIQGKFHTLHTLGGRHTHLQRVIHGMEISAAGIGKDGIGIPIHVIHARTRFGMGILFPFPGNGTIIERIAQIAENGLRRQVIDDHITLSHGRRHACHQHQNDCHPYHCHSQTLLLHV